MVTSGVIIGLLMALHLSSNVPVTGSFPTDELQTRDTLLKSYLDEQAYLQSKIVTLRKDVEKLHSSISHLSEEEKISTLNAYKKAVGLTEVTGPGLEILLDDSPFSLRNGNLAPSEKELIQASDLRDIVNLLFSADAEGISINNQRIIATSAISSVGTTILVNNTYIAPPFTIQAVGDTEIMAQRILASNIQKNLEERKKVSKIIYKITAKAGLLIPIYNSDLKTKHLNIVEQ